MVKITCENGHHLYNWNVEPVPGITRVEGKDFTPIGTAPMIIDGEEIKPCHICGAEFARGGAGWQLHTEEGWKP